jgi:hypothetical protein
MHKLAQMPTGHLPSEGEGDACAPGYGLGKMRNKITFTFDK